jgi:hypothetical protein
MRAEQTGAVAVIGSWLQMMDRILVMLHNTVVDPQTLAAHLGCSYCVQSTLSHSFDKMRTS